MQFVWYFFFDLTCVWTIYVLRKNTLYRITRSGYFKISKDWFLCKKIIAKAPQQFPHLIQLLNWAICNLFISEIIFILKLKIPFSFLKRENIILFTVIYTLHLYSWKCKFPMAKWNIEISFTQRRGYAVIKRRGSRFFLAKQPKQVETRSLFSR